MERAGIDLRPVSALHRTLRANLVRLRERGAKASGVPGVKAELSYRAPAAGPTQPRPIGGSEL